MKNLILSVRVLSVERIVWAVDAIQVTKIIQVVHVINIIHMKLARYIIQVMQIRER